MDECVHGLPEGCCSYCKHAGEGSVWISGGGGVFHRDCDCEGLIDGQRAVERRGGEPDDVIQVAMATALRLSREPCLVCMADVHAGHRSS